MPMDHAPPSSSPGVKRSESSRAFSSRQPRMQCARSQTLSAVTIRFLIYKREWPFLKDGKGILDRIDEKMVKVSHEQPCHVWVTFQKDESCGVTALGGPDGRLRGAQDAAMPLPPESAVQGQSELSFLAFMLLMPIIRQSKVWENINRMTSITLKLNI